MRTIEWILPFVFLATAPAQVEPLTMMRARATNQSGVGLSFEARLEPGGQRSQIRGFGGGVRAEAEAIHRWMVQTTRREYFGYDVRVEPTDRKDEYRISILPLSLKQSDLGQGGAESWTQLSLPRYPAPQLMRPGDTLTMDLLVNPYTGQKVVDYLSIADPSGELRRLTVAGEARDFRIEDAELRINHPRVRINGELVEATRNPGSSASGPIVFVYLQAPGRLLFSLLPRVLVRTPAPPFQKAGEIRGSTMTFQLGGDTYEINCEGRIAPGSGAYSLYVSHDRNYLPPRIPGQQDDQSTFWVGSMVDE